MKKLTETAVIQLPPSKGPHFFAGIKVEGAGITPKGFGVRVTPNGVRSFILRYSFKGRDRQYTIGQHPNWTLVEAVKEARTLRQRVDRGEDPLDVRQVAEAIAKDTVKAVCERYFGLDGKDLRSRKEQEHTLERLVYPEFGSREITSIKRSEIVRLMDGIALNNGPVMADRTLAAVRKVFNWHASRCDEWVSPIVKGMARTKGKERARQRILSDAELRAVWKAAEASTGVYGRLVRFILLTAARREEAAGITAAELQGHTWVLPAARNKTKVALARPLSLEAQKLLPGFFNFSGFSKALNALQAASGTADWTLHDLRRTARSLMSRAGVPADHAERCLGHVIGGVRGVYDVWEYLPEKLKAYDALAGLIDRIVNPVDNVLPLKTAASLPGSRATC